MNPEQNKQNAIAFYKTAYEENPGKAIELYVGNEYIQQVLKISANPNMMY